MQRLADELARLETRLSMNGVTFGHSGPQGQSLAITLDTWPRHHSDCAQTMGRVSNPRTSWASPGMTLTDISAFEAGETSGNEISASGVPA